MKSQTKRFHWFHWLTILIICLAVFLRFYHLNSLPPAPYWEEVALGYDAFSILQTGQDHHGHPFPIVAFESFGDWKPSLYFYAIVPFIKLLGLNIYAVRLPAAISGVSIVLGVGYMTRKIFDDTTGLIAMAVTAISPWAILFSRAGWEVNLATACVVWGVAVFLKKGKWMILSAVLLVLSMYAYHATRLIAPLLGIGLASWWIFSWKKPDQSIRTFFSSSFLRQKLRQQGVWLVAAGTVALVLAWPLLSSLQSTQTTQRLAETSIFTDLDPLIVSNQLKKSAGNSWWSRIVYHRYLLYGKEILGNVFDHLNGNFLFMRGDVNPRHSIQYMGQLYHVELIFLCLGIYALYQNKTRKSGLLAWWLLVGLIPAALTKTTPHALRILPVMPVFMIAIAAGIRQLLIFFPKVQRLILAAIILVYIGEFAMFWRFYTTIYPSKYAAEWQYGYQQMIGLVASYQDRYPEAQVYISREQGRPAMYYWFYTGTDPHLVQAEQAQASKDQGEFLQFQNVHFVTTPSEILQPVEDQQLSGTQLPDTQPTPQSASQPTSEPTSQPTFQSASQPFIIAGSPDFVSRVDDHFSIKEQEEVLNPQGQPVWKVELVQ